MVPDPVGITFYLAYRLHPVLSNLFLVKFVRFLALECLVHEIQILKWFLGKNYLGGAVVTDFESVGTVEVFFWQIFEVFAWVPIVVPLGQSSVHISVFVML